MGSDDLALLLAEQAVVQVPHTAIMQSLLQNCAVLVGCWAAPADRRMVRLAQEAIYQLLRLAGLLEALPLPAGSAQADLVAASISQKATLAEREVCSQLPSPHSHAS